MRKAILFVCLLLAPAWCAAPGLTLVSSQLFQELPLEQGMDTSLRGSYAFRNDTGQVLKNIRLTLHILDGYGRPIMDQSQPVVPRLGPKEVHKFPLYVPVYNGGVAIFQLSADVDAETPGGPQHFVLSPQEAGGPKSNLNY